MMVVDFFVYNIFKLFDGLRGPSNRLITIHYYIFRLIATLQLDGINYDQSQGNHARRNLPLTSIIWSTVMQIVDAWQTEVFDVPTCKALCLAEDQ
jgi:hypothetical protein